jgi:integrase
VIRRPHAAPLAERLRLDDGVVARPSTGQLIERAGKNGRTFSARIRAYGERHYVRFGHSRDGWTRARAEAELANILADVRRGLWVPEPATSIPEPPKSEPSFHEFASEWFDRAKRELRANTVSAYEYEITHHLLPFFAEYRLSEITVEEVDRYRHFKVRERDALRAAHERGEPVRRRPLGNETINKTLTRLGQILEVAVEYGYLQRNPARGRRRRLRVATPERTYLDRAIQIGALIEGAGRLDTEARAGDLGQRKTMVASLVFAGLRLGELLALRWEHVDLAGGRLRVGEAKTDAGVRWIDLALALREELTAHRAKMDSPVGTALVFPTASGMSQSPSNFRNRTMTRAVSKANTLLAARDEIPIPLGLTPRSLRRTFASLLYALGHDPVYVMQQMGHTDPKLALRIYAQAMRRGEEEKAALGALVQGIDWARLGTERASAGSPRRSTEPKGATKPGRSRASSSGRGWVRTSDLSRVRRALSH